MQKRGGFPAGLDQLSWTDEHQKLFFLSVITCSPNPSVKALVYSRVWKKREEENPMCYSAWTPGLLTPVFSKQNELGFMVFMTAWVLPSVVFLRELGVR